MTERVCRARPRAAANMIGAAVVAATVICSTAFATMPSAPVTVTIESAGPVAVDVDLTITLL
ncbi:MAG TPA: hypothetical protein VFN94_04485, partial [Nitrospiria bacterium]|nr:hypothetical protein [Nitrospiria bacterium]